MGPPVCLDWASILDAEYRVEDYKVSVEAGEITVRAVIPGTGDEGQKYPLLFWRSVLMRALFFLESAELSFVLPFPGINLRKCRSRRLLSEKRFYGASSDNVEFRILVCLRIPF